ncbi:YhfG family protein [Halomonas dongshanensis]|uniref:YhfG family protein n=1 Tax=Halomonas dongshanensis TaxID=2890835 RepID=A0ABT2EAS3_9GAMM|nr:YhfG family protein [Halomonas dongshanensis]MCS2608684.1 YhfG family protein [Halomonas dongshanensis]
MITLSMQAKRRYNAQTRRANYQASMALEGILIDPQALKANKANIIAKYARFKTR